jgi:hypothetical protein
MVQKLVHFDARAPRDSEDVGPFVAPCRLDFCTFSGSRGGGQMIQQQGS